MLVDAGKLSGFTTACLGSQKYRRWFLAPVVQTEPFNSSCSHSQKSSTIRRRSPCRNRM